MIYARQMNKSNLDRSSRSVIDSYKEKFRLSNQNLEALRQFLLNAQATAEELKTIMDQQVIDMKEQVDEAVDEAEIFCQNGDAVIETLEEIDDALDNVENDLEDVADDIQDQLDCLDACYGSCLEGQGNLCTTGCEISLDCGETLPCNEGDCDASESCVNGLEERCNATCDAAGLQCCESADVGTICELVGDGICFSLDVACERCQTTGQPGCPNVGEASCEYDIESYYCVYEADETDCLGILDYGTCADEDQDGCVHIGDGCVKLGLDGCMVPGEDNCIYAGEDNCIYVGEDGCRFAGEDLCEMTGEANCTIPGEANCQIPGQGGCIIAGEADCIAAGEDGCTWIGEDNCDYEGEEGCQFAGEEGCVGTGEDNCGYAGEDWTNCDQPVLVACGERWGTCGSTSECPPAFGEAAECGTSQGCGTAETCGGTCNTTCANCEAVCTGTCNNTCANGECSSGECGNCTGSCNTTCANGEGCGTSQTCTDCGLEGGCETCTGTCQAVCANGECNVACTTGVCTICTGSIYQ